MSVDWVAAFPLLQSEKQRSRHFDALACGQELRWGNENMERICLSKAAPLLCVVFCCTVIGCTRSSEENQVVSVSSHTSIESLKSIDRANVSYEDKCIVIQGIISPESQGGWPRDGGPEVHCFRLAAWHRPGEPLVKRDVVILRPVKHGSKYFEDFPAYSIHRMSVLLSTDGKRAVFEKLLPPAEPDRGLLAYGDELRKPVIISTKTFGDIALDRESGCFEVKTKWNEKPVTITFQRDAAGAVTAAVHTAELLWANQTKWDRDAGTCAVRELLPIKNANWLGEHERPLTEGEFLRRMRLESISVNADGSFSFWYEDGDIFWGHSIEVSGNMKDGVRYAVFHG